MEKYKEKLTAEEFADEKSEHFDQIQNGESAEWEKELEEKKKEYEQEKELNALIKRLEKKKREKDSVFVKKKFRKQSKL